MRQNRSQDLLCFSGRVGRLHFQWVEQPARSCVSILPLAKLFQGQRHSMSLHLSAYLLLTKKNEHLAYALVMKEASFM